ncbi:MAG: pitrilysin family protein [Chloroflexota bacterium]
MYQKTILDNGLRITTMNMPQTRSVSIGFFLGIGSRYETAAESGICHFIEHICFKGTTKRETSRDIAAAIEGVGGILNGGTDKELTIYWCKVTLPHFSLAIDVLVDMLLNSKFDPTEIERERPVIIEEINMSKDAPSHWVNMLIDELLWPDHPLGLDTAGTKESVTKITREMMLDFLQSQYQPDNMVVAIAGNIQHEEAVDVVVKALGDWKTRQPHRLYLPYKDVKNPRLLIEKRDTGEAHLCLALRGLPLLHPKRFTFDLLNVILGEGMSSRLFTEIRDKLGLAYSISSYVSYFHDSGSMIIYAGVEPKNVQAAVKSVLEQLDSLKHDVPEAELVRAKESAKGRLLLRMEDTYNGAGWMGGQEILTGRILTLDEVVSAIDEVTTDGIKKLARELLIGDSLRLAVIGPVTDEHLDELLRL